MFPIEFRMKGDDRVDIDLTGWTFYAQAKNRTTTIKLNPVIQDPVTGLVVIKATDEETEAWKKPPKTEIRALPRLTKYL